jgi:hypothetical protein
MRPESGDNMENCPWIPISVMPGKLFVWHPNAKAYTKNCLFVVAYRHTKSIDFSQKNHLIYFNAIVSMYTFRLVHAENVAMVKLEMYNYSFTPYVRQFQYTEVLDIVAS